ncbi:hypothetical protein HX866_11260 [Pseudomonas gingeri]|uniref:hypothetical protein n=1 Tax=Pseudomonas gingeri TaxID=117681 RepID=UPI00159F9EAC|nr:hypothetical protein [Pseudomonas gingeri]NWA25474.1 hypothetical protein [Pseudomonas gingeri]
MRNIPEGWKLVPVEPTTKQRIAVCMHPDLAAALYRSMVGAAPMPPQGESSACAKSQVDRQPSHWAEPGGATITAEVKEHNEMVGGAPAAAAATYTAPLFPQAPAPADARPVTLPDRMEHGFHPMAHEGFRGGWNSCIDAVNKLGPLYTRPDAGDVERLRTEVKRLALMVAQADYNYDADRQQFKRQLAERDALLRKVVSSGNLVAENEPTGETVALHDSIEAVLSDSAEPEVKP